MPIQFEKLFDRYALQARLEPAFITLAPLAIALVAWVPKTEDDLKPLLGLVGGTGVLLLLTQVSRSAGKRLEKKLLANYGGWPSTTMFRLRDTRIDLQTKMRYRKELKALLPDLALPASAEEESDCHDEAYKSVTTFLISRTRNQRAFPLIFSENINYGFRRNLCGLKPIGLTLAIVGTAATLWADMRMQWAPVPLVAVASCFLLSLVWVFYITPGWVQEASEDYARRLFEAIDMVAEEKSKGSTKVKRAAR